MRIPHSHSDREHVDVKMTPMIDVVFLLLIFFVCTASFQVAEALLPTNLAAAGNLQTDIKVDPAVEHVVVEGVFESGQTVWTVNKRRCKSLAEVRSVLSQVAEIDPSLPVILDVDHAVPLGDMIDVYDLSRIAGFDRIQFAAATNAGPAT